MLQVAVQSVALANRDVINFISRYMDNVSSALIPLSRINLDCFFLCTIEDDD